MTNESFVTELIPSISSLVLLLEGEENLQDNIDYFVQELTEYETEMINEGYEEYLDLQSLGHYLPYIINGSGIANTFHIDWKDTESAIGWLEESLLIENIELKLAWSVTDPINELEAYEIFIEANQQLQTINYSLIGLYTGDDSYVELLLHNDLIDQFVEVANQLHLELDWNQPE